MTFPEIIFNQFEESRRHSLYYFLCLLGFVTNTFLFFFSYSKLKSYVLRNDFINILLQNESEDNFEYNLTWTMSVWLRLRVL